MPAALNQAFAGTSTLLQEKIEKMCEEEAAGRARVMHAVALLKSALETNGTRRPELENLELAEALLMAVKTAIYDKGFKSWNKHHTAKPFAFEMARRGLANAAITKIRQKGPDVDAMVEQAMIAKGHQCSDLACAATGVLKRAGVQKETHLLSFKECDHVLLLIGECPAGLSARMEDWPPALAVCDIWANIACAANSFVPEMLRKMDKWGLEGKLVFNGQATNWDPVPAAVLERQMNGDKALMPC